MLRRVVEPPLESRSLFLAADVEIKDELFYEIRENLRVLRHDLANVRSSIQGLSERVGVQNGRVGRLEATVAHLDSAAKDIDDH